MEPEMTRSPFVLAGVAALMGAAGVALAAAGVHANGGELAQRSPRTLGKQPPPPARFSLSAS
jgi:hypothetical protein